MAQTRQRSIFVTVIAWIFIALSGFGTLVFILQNIMLFMVFNSPAFSQAMQAPPPPGMPSCANFMLNHIHLLAVAFLLVSIVTLASSIGLLKRLNWARRCFVGIMALGILWNLGGLVLQLNVNASVQHAFSAMPMDAGLDMRPFLVASAVIGTLFAVGFSVLLGWIAKRLLSPEVALEFAGGP